MSTLEETIKIIRETQKLYTILFHKINNYYYVILDILL